MMEIKRTEIKKIKKLKTIKKMKILSVAFALMLGVTACGDKENSDSGETDGQSTASAVQAGEAAEQGTKQGAAEAAEQGTAGQDAAESGTKQGAAEAAEQGTAGQDAAEQGTKQEASEQGKEQKVATIKETKITLSGNASDVTEIKENSYYEGDIFVLYFEKGATVHGDMAKQIEKVMKDEESLLGMKYEKTEYLSQSTQPDFRMEELGTSFDGVNPEREKVDIFIADYKDDGAVEWSDVNTILLFDEDFEPETGGMNTVYHEMGHVLRLRHSSHLGSIIEEGIGTYCEDMLSRGNGIADWSMVQYYDAGGMEALYDASVIEKDPEKMFREINNAPRTSTQPEYAYGFRFIHFLRETYGEDVVKKLSETAAKYGFGELDTDKIIKILKEATSEDVFERFGKWLPEGWKTWCAGYKKYMNSLGLEF